jgi:hypothetical protein
LAIVIFILLSTGVVNGQSVKPDSISPGVWKGKSICQVKNSTCHDEVVVYYITKGKTPNSFYIAANKIVNGSEEEMGTLHCVFDPKKNELTSTENNNLWTFKLDNDKLNGTLVDQKSLYRM